MTDERTIPPKRRFLAGIMGRRTPRPSVGNVVSVITQDLMKRAGVWFPRAHLEADAMATLAAAGHAVLGFDTIMPVFSVTQEAAALGCEVDWGRPDMMPGARTHPFAGANDFSLSPGWMEEPSIRVVLDAITRLRAQWGDRVAIVGKVMGPWSLSYQMMGVEEFLITSLEAPTRARRCLEALEPVPIAFAAAQIKAGADAICLADHATGGMVSPVAYRDLLLPVHQRICGLIGAPLVLHCCGNTSDRLTYFAQAGFDAYHFEAVVPVAAVREAGGGRLGLMGNINNPDVLLAGTPEMVRQAAHRALEEGVHILAPECAVPLSTPTDNLRTLVEVAEAWT